VTIVSVQPMNVQSRESSYYRSWFAREIVRALEPSLGIVAALCQLQFLGFAAGGIGNVNVADRSVRVQSLLQLATYALV
jgi:hypothetical protein